VLDRDSRAPLRAVGRLAVMGVRRHDRFNAAVPRNLPFIVNDTAGPSPLGSK